MAETTDATESQQPARSSPWAATADPLVVLRGVNKYFGDLHVLRDIDLTIGRREVVIVIGPSGSGKSTLCRAINRLEMIDSGTVEIDGQPLPLEGIEGPEDLAGLRVCSAEGSTPAENIATNYPDAELTLLPEYSLCLEAMLNGQVDALTTDNVILSGYAFENADKVELVGKPFTSEPYGIGVPQEDDKTFCEWVNDSLEEMYADGTWAEAFEATVGQGGVETPEPPATGSCETPGAA